MKLFKTHLCLAVALLGASSVAQAGFLFETTPPQQQQVVGTVPRHGPTPAAAEAGRNVDQSAKINQISKMNRQRIDLESKLTSRITQSGETPGELPILRGLGRDVTLEDALREILPAGWAAYSDQDLNMDQKVNWSGNRTWPMVLHMLLVDLDMRANVDWTSHEVMFFAPAPKEEITKPVIPNAKGVEVRTVAVPAPATAASAAAAPESAAASAPVKTEVVKEVVWTLSPEHTLRENLRRWATAAGWNLVWNAVNGDNVIDYPVDAQVEIKGELLGVDGAMAKVISAYRDAEYPLEIEFFRGNRVVEVRLHRVPDMKAAPDAAPIMAPTRIAPPVAATPPNPAPAQVARSNELN